MKATVSRTLPIFYIHEGQPQVIAAFFSASRDYVKWQDVKTLPREVTFYGADGNRGAVYVHLLVEKLFAGASTNRKVQNGVSIEMDFFAINAEDAHRGRDENGLAKTTPRHKDLDFTVVLNLGGRTLHDSDRIEGCISCIKATGAPSLYVEVKEETPGQTLCELCFELPVSDALLKPIEEKDTFARHVLGWAWCLSEDIKKQYKDGGFCVGENKLDVGNREARFDFLEKEHAAKRLLETVSSIGDFFEGRWPSEPFYRSEYKAAAPERQMDAFIYDEPTWNSLRLSKYLPFKTLEVGSQLGSVGLCNNNLVTYHGDRLLGRFVGISTFSLVNPRNEAFLRGKEALDPCPTIQTALALGDKEYPYAINELQNSYEEQYLFREGTAAQWLNVVEKEFVVGATKHAQPASNPKTGVVLTPADLGSFTSGSNGKVTALTFDYLRDYSREVPEMQTQPPLVGFKEPIVAVWEQKELSLGDFRTISVPVATLKDVKGVFRLELGKGIPAAQERYLNCLHTKVGIEGDAASSVWQAHPYCHRPVLVSYELTRDLSASEMKGLKDAWASKDASGMLGFELTIHEVEGLTLKEPLGKVHLPLPFLDDKCGQAGRHLILLYLVAPQRGHIDVAALPNDKVPLPRRYNNVFGTQPFGLSAIDALVTYRVDDSGAGLFDGNPIISIESLTPLEVRQKSLDSDALKYVNAAARDEGKFLLSFIPGYGSLLAGVWDASLRLVDFAQSDKPAGLYQGKAIDLGTAIVAEIVLRMLKVRSSALEGSAKKLAEAEAGRVARVFGYYRTTGSFVDSIDNTLGDLKKRVMAHASPFKRSAEFQKDPRSYDQLVLIRLQKLTQELKADASGFLQEKVRSDDVVEPFFVRPVDLGRGNKRFPFYYCFGPSGGFLERDDSSAECSLARWAGDFFNKMREYKTGVPDNQTIDEYFAWVSDPANVAKMPFSKSFKDYLSVNRSKLDELRRSKLRKIAQTPGPLSAADREDLLIFSAVQHVWSYLNVMFVRCPACGREMQLNWGWCPYHPTENKVLYELPDKNKSGSWKDEFLAALKDPDGKWKLDEKVFGPDKAVGLVTIADYLERVLADKETRLFVHCSEFIVIK